MSLAARLGLGVRELVAFVGAGGKTSLLLQLGEELHDEGADVVLGTTTRMGTDQVPDWAEVGSTFIFDSVDGPKALGSDPEAFDDLFEHHDFVLVEADGARRKLIKAPAGHEPVIPARTTTVVVVAGADAIGQQLGEVAHRPELVSKITGLGEGELVTADSLLDLLVSPNGGLARVPEAARVVVALTGSENSIVDALANRLDLHPKVDRVLVDNMDRVPARSSER